MSIKATLRKRINDEFILDADLDAFLIDYFEEVWKSLSRGMSRQEKINQLLTMKEVSEIERTLAPSEKHAASSVEKSSTASSEESAKLRQEITRLQQVIRDLEQQLSGQKSEPKIHPRNGLDRIQKCLKDFEDLSATQSSIYEQKWMTLGHNVLDALESSLGKFHHITCDFRIRFVIEKEPISLNYQALINAALAILKQLVEEDERAAQSFARTAAALNSRKRDPWAF